MIMVTETSSPGTVDERQRWMDETIFAIYNLRRKGVPVMGYTWFPFLSMINWVYRREIGPVEDHLLHLGLYDSAFDSQGRLQRHETPLAVMNRQHVSNAVPPLRTEPE
jgi:hypothetical protein